MDDYDRQFVHHEDRIYVILTPWRLLEEQDDIDDDMYQGSYLPGTRVVILMVYDDLEEEIAAALDGHDNVAESRASKHARLAEDAMEGLPEVKPPSKQQQQQADCCAVCLNDFDELDKLRAMPCAHAFHEDCIFRWLRRNAVCPLCRHPLPLPTHEDEDD